MVLGRPKCILDTNRVDRRPEKAVTRSDLGGGRGQREEKVGFCESGVGAAAGGFGAVRGGCGGKGKGFERETCWVVHWLP